LIKNYQPFGKKCQKTAGGFFLTHTVETDQSEHYGFQLNSTQFINKWQPEG